MYHMSLNTPPPPLTASGKPATSTFSRPLVYVVINLPICKALHSTYIHTTQSCTGYFGDSQGFPSNFIQCKASRNRQRKEFPLVQINLPWFADTKPSKLQVSYTNVTVFHFAKEQYSSVFCFAVKKIHFCFCLFRETSCDFLK